MFAERLKELRKERNYSMDALAEIYNRRFEGRLNKSTISRYENSIQEPMYTVVKNLAVLFCVSTDYLLGNVDDPFFYLDNERILREINYSGGEASKKYTTCQLTPSGHRIGRAYEKAPEREQGIVEHVLDPYMEEDDPPDNIIHIDFNQSEQRASAGRGILLGEESMLTIKVDADALPSDYQRNPERYFGVPVGGDSMEPVYHDGDVLIVSKEPVNIGEIGIFTMEGEGYVKELGRGVLHSLNENYEDIPLTEDIRCNGKVIGVLDPEDVFEE